jgi:hypothetical protein
VTRVCWLLPGVPFAYLAVILWLQPPDHLGFHPDKAPWLGRLVYDDFDVTAYAMRGLNAHAGRTPGLDEEPSFYLAAALDDPGWSPRERYYLEYPVPALLLFRLGWDWQPDPRAPPALYDAPYHAVVLHVPRDAAERRLWSQLRRATQTYLVLMAGCCAALMAVLLVGYERGGGLAGGAILLALPAALYFGLHRFDALPALLTAIALACLGRRWVIASAAFLALAAAVKVYPALLAPLVVRYLWADRRAAVAWAAAFGATGAAAVLPALFLFDWQAVWAPYRFQLARWPYSPTAYGYVLPASLGRDDLPGHIFRHGALALALLLFLWRRPPDLTALLRRGALLFLLVVTLPVFYSPQWILWLIPLLAPLTRRQWPVLGLAVALDLITYLTFPVALGVMSDDAQFLGSLRAPLREAYDTLLGALVYARFAVLGGLALALLRADWRQPA